MPWWTLLRSLLMRSLLRGALRSPGGAARGLPANAKPLAALLLQRHAAQPLHVLARAQLHQAGDGRLDEVDGVAAAVHLGQDVAHAGHFEHVADAGAGLDAGAGAGRHENDAAAAVLADDAVRDGVALERDALLALHRLLGVLGGLLDGRRQD